ncbi:MFS transporter [Angustibacter speluncae]
MRGGLLPFVALIAVGACLRTPVASLAPIADELGDALRMSALDYSVLSTVPVLCFALAGFLTPGLVRRRGVVVPTLAALVAMLVGTAGRAAVSSFEPFLALSLTIYLGIGVGNVMVAPLVKRYFPHRVQSVTMVCFVVMSMSTFVPPLLSAPLADLGTWRLSVSAWAVLVALALVPVIWLRFRSQGREPRSVAPKPRRTRRAGVLLSGRAWALAMLYGVTTFNVYAFFAWLPQILTGTFGWSVSQASLLLGLYSALGLPLAVLVPALATRMRRPALLAVVAGALTSVGNAALVIGPTTTAWIWVWVCVAGACQLLFPLGITLLVTMSADEHEAASLGGFAQGTGYLLGAAGPMTAGMLFDASGAWSWTLVMLCSSGSVAAAAGIALVVMSSRRAEISRPPASIAPPVP